MLRTIIAAVAAILSCAVAANADAPTEPTTLNPAEQAASSDPAYIDGRRDRRAWEDWFRGLALGSYQDGALWWFGERSKASPRGCVSPSGNAEWMAGCKAAQQRLALSDVRWKTEALYALGWQSEVAADIPPEPITMPDAEKAASTVPAFADGRRDRAAWEEWLRRLPAGSYRDGAFFWLDEHERQRPQPCASPSGGDRQWVAGCRSAQARLALPDVRRTTEVDYRLGWISEAASPAPQQ